MDEAAANLVSTWRAQVQSAVRDLVVSGGAQCRKLIVEHGAGTGNTALVASVLMTEFAEEVRGCGPDYY